MARRPSTAARTTTVTTKLSRLHRPQDMTLEHWQRELRRQYGRAQPFGLENMGTEPVFSDFRVSNPQSGGAYRVAIRGPLPGDNSCTCGDFATDALGTCKHIEFVLGRLEKRRGGRSALHRGFQPPYSEIVLQYGAERKVRLRRGTDCPPPLAVLAARYFDREGVLRPRAFSTFESFLSKAAGFGHDLRCYEDALGFVAEVRDRSRREKAVARAFPRGARIPRSPSSSRARFTPTSARRRCSRRARAGASSATRWDWGRPSRPSWQRRSWRATSGSSVSSSSAPRRSSTSGSARSAGSQRLRNGLPVGRPLRARPPPPRLPPAIRNAVRD